MIDLFKEGPPSLRLAAEYGDEAKGWYSIPAAAIRLRDAALAAYAREQEEAIGEARKLYEGLGDPQVLQRLTITEARNREALDHLYQAPREMSGGLWSEERAPESVRCAITLLSGREGA